jgi:protoporphyrinogen oxidase
MPGKNWTEVLCAAMTRLLTETGVRIFTSSRVSRIATSSHRVVEITTEGGATLGGDVFVSTLPTELLTRLVPDENSPYLREIRYTALTSVIGATAVRPTPDFYWMNLFSPERAASGLFLLNSLNPTLGTPGVTYANFVTHTRSRHLPFFRDHPGDEVGNLYFADFRSVFGQDMAPTWIQVNRVPMYSPVFVKGYRNPPVHSTSSSNLFFAGNFRTHPSVVSTGTALQSGLDAAQAILQDHPAPNDIWTRAAHFRLPGGVLAPHASGLLSWI